MKRMASALLAALFILSALSACSEQPSDVNVTSFDTEEDALTTTEEVVDYSSLTLLERLQLDYNAVPDDLPEKDYGGAIFRLNYIDRQEIFSSIDESAEIVGAAMYNRQLEIEERFNIVFEPQRLSESDFNGAFNQLNAIFLAQDDAFDLMSIWNTMAGSFVREGYLADLSQLTVLDFSKPWFYTDAIQALSYKNHSYVSVDMMISLFGELECMYFNKNIATDNNLEDFYQVVRDGNWTLDYVQNIVKDFWIDVNGDSKINTDADILGMHIPVAQFSYSGLPALGAMIIGKDDSDVPYMFPTKNMEQVENVYSRLRTLVRDCDGVSKDDWSIDPFIAGNRLFAIGNLGSTAFLREVDFEYGILPLFKFDENQSDYKSCLLPSPSAIPNTCTDQERSAIILSALAAGGYKKVSVAYFETALKSKYAMDEQSAEMLDIIASNVITDGTVMYTDALIYTFLDFIYSTNEFPSFWAKREKMTQNYLDTMTEKMDEMIETSGE